jgi:hypothetical protein
MAGIVGKPFVEAMQNNFRISRPRLPRTDDARSRVICPGGVGFETSSAKGHTGAVLVANATRAGLHGVSVRVIGNRLGLQISKSDDKQVNANGETSKSESV